MTIWSLWRKRNTQIWEDKVETVLQIMVVQIILYMSGSTRRVLLLTDQLAPWQPPPPTYLNCNIDAVVFIVR
ncbi:hypothetical protein A2U01_0068391 [Trifolium medium]|uniref:Uncharacterized protein n=1 Tax=Trifolium medium TaxID=97028 RepID=A0A392SGQ6_9FABA|nr:hypothetical protein [Trifolium medium]